MSAAKKALELAFDVYLSDFGDDDHDESSYIDFVMAQLVMPSLGGEYELGGCDRMIEWLRGHANRLEADMNLAGARLQSHEPVAEAAPATAAVATIRCFQCKGTGRCEIK